MHRHLSTGRTMLAALMQADRAADPGHRTTDPLREVLEALAGLDRAALPAETERLDAARP
jgi:hypothetical protein